MRLAFTHDFLLRFGGAERVLKEMHELYPSAPIFTLAADKGVIREWFPKADIRVSALGKLPAIAHWHRVLLPLIPFAVESFDLREYDVVVSSASGLIKGVVTRSHARHFCYCHTPPRYLWEDRDAYLRHAAPPVLRQALVPMLHFLRLWDQQAAQRVDQFLANSRYTQERISRYYRKLSVVLFPPVELSTHELRNEIKKQFSLPDEYFLFVGHLAWWKRPELLVETFNRLGLPFFLIGRGPLERRLARLARKNVHLLGPQSDAVVRQLMSGARAMIHPQTEDFGISAVEAMAEGTPIVAFRAGGARETVLENVSGVFFDDPDPVALADAVRRLRERSWDKKVIQKSVSRFSQEIFREGMRREIEKVP